MNDNIDIKDILDDKQTDLLDENKSIAFNDMYSEFDKEKLVKEQKEQEIFEKEIEGLMKDINLDSMFINIYSLFEASIRLGKNRYVKGLDKKHLNIVYKSEDLLKSFTNEEKLNLVKRYAMFVLKNS